MANVVRRGVAAICTARSLEEIPSPNGALPLLGHYLQIRRRPGNLSSLYEKYFKELGPIFKVKIPGGKNIVCFADPDGMESVYRNEGANPIRTYTAPANFQWFYNKEKRPVPFVFQTGKKWKELRTMHSKQSAPNNVYKHIPGFISATNRLIRNISKYATTEDGYIEDIDPLIMSWSLEASIYFTMGADLDLIESASTEETQSFQKGISTLISTIDDFAMALPIFKLFPTKITRDLKKATDDLYSVGEKYINKHLQETNTGHSLIEQWLQDDKLSKKDMIMSAIFLFGTGVDTILSNSIFMLYELSKHPEIQDKVYHEVVSVLGEKGEVDSIALQKMPYLGQVIKETQRLYPISPHHIRTLPTDIDVLGYNIPAQTLTMYSMLAVAKDPKYFNDPCKFDPDRWARDYIHPFAIVPFGIGPRSCWGRRFAEVEMKILLTQICQNFILESNNPPNLRLPTTEKLFARPNGSVNIKFTTRK